MSQLAVTIPLNARRVSMFSTRAKQRWSAEVAYPMGRSVNGFRRAPGMCSRYISGPIRDDFVVVRKLHLLPKWITQVAENLVANLLFLVLAKRSNQSRLLEQ